MSALTPEKLYELLPAVHRIRDAERGSPLAALLSVAAEQGALVEDDITQLFDNWFIETCEEWVVPYIGDLLGVRGLHDVQTDAAFTQRARVANILSYRRRKGTATMLEQLAKDTTGWPARVVEFFQILGWNQNANHIRPNAHRTPDLRRTNELELLTTAFDSASHTVDVRRIEIDRGRHNLPNIGIFLWRLQSYFITGGTARKTGGGFSTFNPLGQLQPLFNRPQTETSITHLAEEFNVPGQLRRRPLYDELEARRTVIAVGGTPRGTWFGAKPVFQLFQQPNAGDPFTLIASEKIRLCHLGPGASRPAPGGTPGNPEILAGVDPVLGRIAWADTLAIPNALKVGYAYGFNGDLGGGPYNRTDSVEEVLQQRAKPKLQIDWQVGVAKEITAVGLETIFTTLSDAINEWHSQVATGTPLVGVIAVLDSQTYKENLAIKVPEGCLLFIVAADWPALPVPGGSPGQTHRLSGKLSATEVRPHLLGNMVVVGTAPESSESPGSFAMDGFLVEGSLTVDVQGAPKVGNLGALRLAHTTLVPSKGGLTVTAKNKRLQIKLVRAITGPITLADPVPSLTAQDSIIDGGSGDAILALANALDLQSSTVIGRTRARTMDAGNSIFTAGIEVARQQEGCVRFSFIPDGSHTGRRYRCQPELALSEATKAAEELGQSFDASEEAALLARVVPGFVSKNYGDPTYGQLALTCAPEIRTGAEDGSEMGAFRFLQHAQREANLRSSLDEFLRFGLEAGLIFAT